MLPLTLLLLSCGGDVVQRVGAPPKPPQGKAFLKILCEPPQTEIYLDGAYRGRLDGYPEGFLSLDLGKHRLRLAAPGHEPAYFHFELRESLSLKTRLLPTPPES